MPCNCPARVHQVGGRSATEQLHGGPMPPHPAQSIRAQGILCRPRRPAPFIHRSALCVAWLRGSLPPRTHVWVRPLERQQPCARELAGSSSTSGVAQGGSSTAG